MKRVWGMLIAATLAPLSLIVLIPVITWLADILSGHKIEWAMILVAPLALFFGYAGFLIFGLPLFAGVLALNKWPTAAVCFSVATGWFASLVTPQLVESNREIAISNLRVMFETPSFWASPVALAGGGCGLVFWLITWRLWHPAI